LIFRNNSLPNITELYIRANLSTVKQEFGGAFGSLHIADFSHNSIASFSNSYFEQEVNTLSLSNNLLAEWRDRLMPSLGSLSLDSNLLEEFSNNTLSQVRIVSLKNNSIKSMANNQMPSLIFLNLDSNELEVFECVGGNELETLILSIPSLICRS
jgi:hypothetical protein